MYTIQNTLEYELIVKNSRFIALLHPIIKEEQVKDLLANAKAKYPKATHYTYAWRVGVKEKSSDDKEPSGTAGIPILNVLQKQEMTNILVIIVRYFGGIKLGAGGLIRAYSTTCKEALKHSTILKLVPAKKVIITTNYNKIKELNHLLQNENILEKNFAEEIFYTVLLENESILNGKFSYEVLGEELITKNK